MEISNINESVLLQYFSGSLSREEVVVVEQWISASEDNRRVARQIQSIRFAMNTVDTLQHVNPQAALSNVKKRIHKNKRVSAFTWIQRIAAILFIPLLIGTVYNQFKPKEQTRYMETHTSPGMIASLELPDGSRVWLNGDSYLKYPMTFDGQQREVHLNGEAYFTVRRDRAKPFVVRTKENLNIEVLGTEFNIDAYETNSFIATTLIEGSVKLSYMNNEMEVESLIMYPDEQVIYDRNTREINQSLAFVPKETAWKNGSIILRDTPLNEVLWMLSKRYNVDFEVKRESLKENSFTGTFTNQQLVRILDHFKIASGINYSLTQVTDKDGNILRTKVKLY